MEQVRNIFTVNLKKKEWGPSQQNLTATLMYQSFIQKEGGYSAKCEKGDSWRSMRLGPHKQFVSRQEGQVPLARSMMAMDLYQVTGKFH